MTDAELLLHYIQSTRITHGAQRSAGHPRLLKLGFIAEHPGQRSMSGRTPPCGVSSLLTPRKRLRTMAASREPARLVVDIRSLQMQDGSQTQNLARPTEDQANEG
jgi:hypothetical protein